MPILARDLMETDLLTLDPNAPLLQAHRLFLEEEINGAPVVDEDGHLFGVISSLDLLRAVEDEYGGRSGATVPFYFHRDLPYSGPDWLHDVVDFQDRIADLRVADAMVTEVVSVPSGTLATDIARIMRTQRIHRILIIDDGELLGIVSTFDLMRLLETASAPEQLSIE